MVVGLLILPLLPYSTKDFLDEIFNTMPPRIPYFATTTTTAAGTSIHAFCVTFLRVLTHRDPLSAAVVCLSVCHASMNWPGYDDHMPAPWNILLIR